MSGSDGEERPDLLGRLDPDRARRQNPRGEADAGGPGDSGSVPPAAQERSATAARRAPATPGLGVDPRRYGWIVGGIGLALVIVVSVIQFAAHGVGGTGIAPGQRLHFFSAPLADSTLVGDANLSPPCTEARHDPRALNVCLLARREPVVLSFFVTGQAQCTRQVDALQQLSRRFPAIAFAAVAVDGTRAATRRLIRRHGWTIPVAYDADGSVGATYAVAICPMAELARRGGVVADRLLGDRWQSAAALAPRVAALQRAGATG